MTIVPRDRRSLRAFALMLLAVVSAGLLSAPSWATGEGPGDATRRGDAPMGVAESAHVIAAGDIACDPRDEDFNGGQGKDGRCKQMATSDLWVDAPDVEAALILGDVQYEDGKLRKFERSYDPSWGRGIGVTLPAPGNHEYRTPGAQGYFDYFGSVAQPPGWYSADVGPWHLVSLNSTCPPVNCAVDSPQVEWLRDDLAEDDSACTLAFFHHPLIASVGPAGDPSFPKVKTFWRALFRDRADLILVGHQHTYERFAPMTPKLVANSTKGIRQFIVGTGGKDIHQQDFVAPNSERRIRKHGILHLELSEGSYAWAFETIAGNVLDEGTGSCV
ncbi:MAG: metallophosphoesterase [Actinomycetota bacterium]